MPKKILVISHDKVGSSMAGPGIRYHHIATHLSKKHDVTLAVFNPSYIENIGPTKYKAIDIHARYFHKEFAKYDAIIALWLSDEMIEFAKKKNIVLIFDLYAPVPVEILVQNTFSGNTDKTSDFDFKQMIASYGHILKNGDYFLMSNEQQRDFWIGYAFANQKICPSRQKIRSIDSFFGICPMGIDTKELRNLDDKDQLTNRIPQIKKSDFVIVWTGGIWDWFDAITPIKAIENIVKNGEDNVKLVFLGTKHPNDEVPAMAETEKARELAKSMGLLEKYVFFLDGWLPYEGRTHYLNRANIALYAHKPSIESRFSHRTRVLDHILMSLPTIATKGDYFADFISRYNLGIAVDPFDYKAMTKSILELKNNPDTLTRMRGNIKSVQPQFTWESTLSELDKYIDSVNFTPSVYVKRPIENSKDIIKHSPFSRKIKRLVPQRIKNLIKQMM